MQSSDDREIGDIEHHVARHRRRQPDPRRIADAISDLFARRGYAQIQLGAEYQKAWAQVAGEKMTRHSRPTRLRRGVLHITVQNSVALQELTFQKTQMLKRIKEILAREEIRDLRFQIGSLQ